MILLTYNAHVIMQYAHVIMEDDMGILQRQWKTKIISITNLHFNSFQHSF